MQCIGRLLKISPVKQSTLSHFPLQHFPPAISSSSSFTFLSSTTALLSLSSAFFKTLQGSIICREWHFSNYQQYFSFRKKYFFNYRKYYHKMHQILFYEGSHGNQVPRPPQAPRTSFALNVTHLCTYFDFNFCWQMFLMK